jgi:hypothetical protein
MQYTIETDHDKKLMICLFNGTLNTEVARKATGELNRKALEYNYNKLYDVSGARLSVSLGDSYFFPRELLSVFTDKAYKKLKVAIHFTQESDQEFWEFFKNTTQNVGYSLEVFRSRDEAIGWLNA